MAQGNVPAGSRLGNWFKKQLTNRAYDCFDGLLTLCEGTRFGIKHWLTRIVTFVKPRIGKRKPRRSYQLSMEEMEGRVMPTAVSFAASAYTIAENAGAVTTTVNLDASSGSTITVHYNTKDATAIGGSDYTGTTGTLTFNPGDTSKTITVSITNDSLDENDETFAIELTSPTNATLGSIIEPTVTITDDDPTPTVQFTASSQTGAESVGTMTITASLSAVSGRDVTLPFTLGGTATAGSDYTDVPASPLTITAGNTTGIVKFIVTDDALDEDDETIIVTMGTPTNATASGTTAHTMTITDNDPTPTITFTSSSQTGAESVGTMTITASLSAVSGRNVVLPFTLGGTATVGPDYFDVPTNPLLIIAGNQTGIIKFIVIDDSLDEDDETIIVTMGTPTNATASGTTAHTMTITDNDPTPTITFSSSSQTGAESVGTMTVTASLSAVSGRNVTLPFTLSGTASAGPDYTPPGPLTITAGNATGTIKFIVTDDALDEDDETIIVNMGSPTNATASGTTAHTMTITDNDPTPTITFTSSSQTGAESVGTMTITASLSAVSGRNVTLPFSLSGTATAGPDYIDVPISPLVITAGNSTGTIKIIVNDDSLDENDETVIVTMGTPTNATASGTTAHTATITDNDPTPTITFTSSSQTGAESVGTMTITASLSAVSGRNVTLPFSLSGTATAGPDYTDVPAGPLTIAAGSATGIIKIIVLNDVVDEDDETVIVTMGTPTNATASGTTTHTVTITDDDPPTHVEFNAGSYTVSESVGNATMAVTVGATAKTVTVVYGTSDGTASSASDYSSASGTLTFLPGDGTKYVTVPITNDTMDENDETVVLTLSSPGNATLGTTSTATLTITDNDDPPTVQFTSSSYTVGEADGTKTITASLSAASGKTITVAYATSNGTASSSSDYTSASGTLTFSPGDLTKTFTVSITNDTTDENDETVNLALSGPSNTTLGSPSTSTLTIVDDDDPPTVQFTSSSASAGEADGTISITATLSAASGKTITVAYASSDGTATAGLDYTAVSGTHTFNPGDTSFVFTVPVTNDLWNEGAETLTLALSGPTNATLGSTDSAVLTIVDDEVPLLAVDDPNGVTAAWWAFDEGTGTTAGDQMAGLQATLPDGVTWSGDVAGALSGGHSLQFSSAAGPVQADGFDLRTTDLTVSLWAEWSSVGNTLLAGQDDGSGNLWSFSRDAGHLKFSVGTAGNTPTTPLDYSWTPSTDTWYHLAVTRTGGAWALYIDGSSVATNTAALTLPDLSGTPLSLGSTTFAGNLDDLRLFHSALGGSDISAIHGGTYTPVAPLSTDEDTPLTISASSLLANDVDGNGDGLVVTGYSQPAYGTLAYDLSTGDFTYTPSANYNGLDCFNYTINDGHAGSSTASVFVQVAPVNDAPTAHDDWAYPAKNTAVTVPVLTNDSDVDTGDTLTVTGKTDGAHGTVSITGSGTTVTYTPDTDYTGVDTFTYTISDGNGGTDTGTVNVYVANGQWANSVIAASSSWTDSGPYASYAVQALGAPNTIDYGDSSSAWAPAAENGATAQTIALGFATPDYANGVLIRETSGNGFVTQIDLLDSDNTWHNSVWSGTDSSASGSPVDFVVTFTETGYLVKGARITVNPDHDASAWEEIDAVKLLDASTNPGTNTAPTITSAPATASVDEDSSVNVTLSTLASDADSDPLLFQITSDPTNGTAALNDNNTPNDLTDDYLTYTPDADYNGSDSFTYQVTDIYGATASGTINVTVNAVNDAPVASADSASADKNTAVVVHVLANDSDVDTGDTLTVSSKTNGAHGSVTITDSGTTVTYTPTTDYTGLDEFTYTISDGNGGTSTANVFVSVYETGQWATSVVSYSSQYATGDSTDWAATQALGAPDTFGYGDSSTAWAPADENSDTAQTLAVGFTTPAQATGVVIREINGNGFVTKIELEDTDNAWHEIWPLSTGQSDPALAGKPTDVVVRFAQTAYNVKAVRITANTNHDANAWEEIDAIRLLTGGSPGSTSITAVAIDQAPVAVDDWASADKNAAVTVFVMANDYDPDAGDTFTITAKTNGTHGTVAINSGTTVTYTPDTDYTGSDTFTVTIDDGCGGTATSTVHVTVGDGQWASTIAAASSESNDGVYGSSVWALGPGDTAIYGDTTNSWSPDSSSTATEETLTLGIASADHAGGVLIRESSGNGFVTKVELQDTDDAWHTVWTGTDSTAAGAVHDFVVTFSATAYEAEAVRITVNPATGDGSPVGIDAVKVLTSSAPPSLPAAPSASNDSVTINQEMPVNILVLANDTNTDDSRLFLHITSAPTHGSVAIDLHGTPADSSDDRISYTPDAGYSGSDSFAYSITDAFGHSSSATVSVTVDAVNQAPVTQDDLAHTDVNAAVVVHVLGNDADSDSGDTLTVTAVTQGQNGTVTITGSGTPVTYTPDTDFTGPDNFTYTISDGHSHSITAQVNVLVYEPGQWANAVLAVSSGADSTGSVLGAADDTPWTPDDATQLEFIAVGFTAHNPATGVLVREASGGAVRQIQLQDTDDAWHTIWTGADPTSGAGDFVLNFPETEYDVKAVKVFLTTQNGDASLDAIRLLTGGDAGSVTVNGRAFDGSGSYTDTAYNSAGQPVTVDTYAFGLLFQSVEYTYSSGHLSTATTTDALGNQTHCTYDADGNKLTETDGYGTGGASTTTWVKVTSLTDPKGNETTWDYETDETEMTDPFGNTQTQHFNAQGKLDWVLNRNNKLTTYEYDDQGRLQTETMYDGPTDEDDVVDTLSWSYNAAGEMASASSDLGEYDFRYDFAGRVSHVDEPFGVSLDFGYDQYGNRNVVIDSLGGEEDSLYNASGQLLSRVLTQGDQTLRIDFTYDQNGRVVTEKRYSDAAATTLVATTTHTYDEEGNVASIVTKDGSNATISEFDYSYDVAGQLASETDFQAAIDESPNTIDYTMDAQGQLTGDGTNSYNYDQGGNRDTGNTYVENPDEVHDTNELLSDGTWTYVYDGEGNTIEKDLIGSEEKWTYGYDNQNHLIHAEHFDDTSTLDLQVDYGYDVFGNRVGKDVTQDDTTTATRFAQDGWNPAKPSPVGNENFDVWADLNGDSSLKTRYDRGDNVDEVKARVDSIESVLSTNWLLTDHLGSVRDVIDNTGTPVDSLKYDGFGNIDDATELDPEYRGRYTWTGRELDVETQLQFNRARYYDALTGRWISQDPMGFDAGDSNLYRYVKNAPTMATDPSGLQGSDGVDASDKLMGNPIEVAGRRIGITVTKDVVFRKEKWIRIQAQARLKDDDLDDFYWVQMTIRFAQKKDGSYYEGVYDSKNLKKPYLPYDTTRRFVDREYSKETIAYGGQTSRRGTLLSIEDSPTRDPDNNYQKTGQVNDCFLVYKKQVVYHVHWEMITKKNGKWDTQYTNIRGNPIDAKNPLPDYLKTKKLIFGYEDPEQTDVKDIDNTFFK